MRPLRDCDCCDCSRAKPRFFRGGVVAGRRLVGVSCKDVFVGVTQDVADVAVAVVVGTMVNVAVVAVVALSCLVSLWFVGFICFKTKSDEKRMNYTISKCSLVIINFSCFVSFARDETKD